MANPILEVAFGFRDWAQNLQFTRWLGDPTQGAPTRCLAACGGKAAQADRPTIRGLCRLPSARKWVATIALSRAGEAGAVRIVHFSPGGL